MHRKFILGLTAVIALISTGLILAFSGPVHAAPGGYNCVSRIEQDHLRLGMTPQQVKQVTGASPWFRTTQRIDGRWHTGAFYSDCNTGTGKTFAAIYRVRADGSRHLFAHMYLRP